MPLLSPIPVGFRIYTLLEKQDDGHLLTWFFKLGLPSTDDAPLFLENIFFIFLFYVY